MVWTHKTSTSNSPVLDEYFDPGQGSGCVDPEVLDDDKVERIVAYLHVTYGIFYSTYASQANWCETFPATSGPTAPVFACSAPVLHSVLTNRRAFVFSADVTFAATNDSHSSTFTS